MHPQTYRTGTATLVIALILFAAGCGSNQPAGDQAASPDAGEAAQPAAEAGQPAAAQPGRLAPRSAAPQAQQQSRARPSAVAPAPQPPRPRTLTLEQGTVLAVRTTSTLSTRTNQSGQQFEATLEKPVIVDGREVLPRGAAVSGRIVEADAGGRVRGVASITLALSAVRVGGESISISTDTVSRQAAASKKKDAAKVGIGAGIGAAVGAIAGGGRGAAIGAAAGGGAGTAAVLATRGDAAVVPAESLLNFQLAAPVTIVAGP